MLCMGFVLIRAKSYKTEQVSISTQDSELNCLVLTPNGYKDYAGLILFVHGDGPVDATANKYYEPIWQMFAKQGYAMISWDKPGVNESKGNWLDQTMQDRADEVALVIDWARQQQKFNEIKIGLWGTSQAGWVIPKVVAMRDIDFTILLSPAINWLRQGKYNTIEYHRANGATEEEITAEIEGWDEELKLLEDDISYEEYIKLTTEEKPMEQDRWSFVKSNYMADAMQELRNFETPVLLILGGRDINVDSRETRMVYEQEVEADILKVAWFEDSAHNMINYEKVDTDIKALLTWIFSPSNLFDDGFLDEMEAFIKEKKG